MEFGTLIFTKPQRAITDPKLAEDYGYSHAWIPDSHMIWGDVWACMALAAVNTTKIKLATGVAIATNRIPPVTVEAIGTINEIAPGRVILGFGTGHTGRRVMGLPPVKQAVFREEVRVIHDHSFHRSASPIRGHTTSMAAPLRTVVLSCHRPPSGRPSGPTGGPLRAPPVTRSATEMVLQCLQGLLVDPLHHLRHLVRFDHDVPCHL